MPDYDNNYLLEVLRSHTRIPSVLGFDDASCLRDLTGTLHGYILPMVKAEWQENWVAAETATTHIPLVDGQAEYELPRRAVAGSVRTAVLLSQDGRVRTPLHFMEIDELERLPPSSSTPSRYALRSNRIVLYPTPGAVSGHVLRLPMLIRPARLVSPSACAVVTAVGGSGPAGDEYIVTVASPPMSLTALTTLDVVRGREPFENVQLERAGAWAGSDLAFTIDFEDLKIQVGDYICPPGTSPFPQCPVELIDLLARRTAVEQLAGSGDTDVAGAKAAPLGEGRRDAVVTVRPRSGDPRPLRNGLDKWGGGGRGGGSYW
jgi:hypothetical protein